MSYHYKSGSQKRQEKIKREESARKGAQTLFDVIKKRANTGPVVTEDEPFQVHPMKSLTFQFTTLKI